MLWLAAFAALGLIFWNRIPVWSKWLCGAMVPSPLISLAFIAASRRRIRIRRAQGIPLARNRPHTTLRVLIAFAGIFAGWSIYSYGMFHTLRPTWAQFADIANCGVSADTRHQRTSPMTFGDPGGTLCQVAPGQWRKSPYSNDPFFLGLAVAFLTVLIALVPFLRWAIGSVWRFGVLGMLLWGIPMTLLGLQMNFVEGTLTPDWAIHVVVYSELIAAIGSAIGYPMLKGSTLKRSRGT